MASTILQAVSHEFQVTLAAVFAVCDARKCGSDGGEEREAIGGPH